MTKYILIFTVLLFAAYNLNSQGYVSGNFQFEGQYYENDPNIGTTDVPQELAAQGYLFMIYNIDDFEFGLRYEAYKPPLLGIDSRFNNSGFPFMYGTYRSDLIEVTGGNFYEQFGSGLIFRSYEERALGFDNAINGIRIKFRPDPALEITGLVGNQREFWDKSDGIVRGLNANIYMDMITDMFGDNGFTLGASLVSKYQRDNESFYNLPENVLSYSFRGSWIADNYSINAEYAKKANDPGSVNQFSYNEGEGFIVTTSYYDEGFGLTFDFHRADNMDFRSERGAVGNVLNINFIPPLTRQHTYALTSLYPFATQFVGEIGLQGEMTFKTEKGALFGGNKYGTTFLVNYSRVHNIDSTAIDEFEYQSDFFAFGDRLFFEDFNVQISRRWSEDFKTTVSYINQTYDKDVSENGWAPQFGKVYSHIAVFDAYYRLSDDYALHADIEHIWATQDSTLSTPDPVNGNWAMALLELTISPNYYISITDQYNYGNAFGDNQLHYYMGSIAYVHDATRFQLSYGRQRAGIVCVGGVCRAVPASSGAYLSVTSSF